MFYEFRQNNSGGAWGGPAMTVFIEADSGEEANSIAENNGLYFDGVGAGLDCECCGDRWYRKHDNSEGTAELPNVETPREIYAEWSRRDKVDFTVAFFKDGRKEVL